MKKLVSRSRVFLFSNMLSMPNWQDKALPKSDHQYTFHSQYIRLSILTDRETGLRIPFLCNRSAVHFHGREHIQGIEPSCRS